jgi:hypothetical protein
MMRGLVHTKINRSRLLNRSRTGDLWFSTESCRRRTRFSASSLARDLKWPRNTGISRVRDATIGALPPHLRPSVTQDQVVTRHREGAEFNSLTSMRGSSRYELA